MELRLQSILAQAGIASRRKAEELIREGRVQVNGSVVTALGTKADPDRDFIKVDGKSLRRPGVKAYFLLHKPPGYLCSLKDEKGKKRPLVTGLLRKGTLRLFPVGRLDFDAEGALLLTNDGELAHRLTHPRFGVPKTYEVKVRGVPGEEAIERLRSGAWAKGKERGAPTPARARLLKVSKKNSWLLITLTEGKTHQVKRMCEAIGHPALRLRRTRFGHLGVKGLSPGTYRSLTPEEVRRVKALVGL